MTSEQKWQIVLDRSAHHDGMLFYAVRTTGVYCRPSCPSRRPRRESVEFFSTSAEAERAGYRACQRCRPSQDTVSALAVEAVRRRIDASLDQGNDVRLTLAELAAESGLSPYHLQRIFKRTVGVSPREYQQAGRLRNLKQQMQAGEPVTDAIYAAGFASSSRVYEKAGQELGMTPGQYRRRGAGVTIRFACFSSPLGGVLLAATEKGLCRLAFGGREEELKQSLFQEFPRAELREDPAALAPFRDRLLAWLADTHGSSLQLPLDPQGTGFQRKVWNLLQQIPLGETRSYQQLAEAIGDTDAARAVARACATNPVAIAIPCHRVVRKDGGLAGYRWGLERKVKLLEHEGSLRRRERGASEPAS